jgi:hypothetical protein
MEGRIKIFQQDEHISVCDLATAQYLKVFTFLSFRNLKEQNQLICYHESGFSH